MMERDAFFREYTSQDAIVKYTRVTAGFGVNYLLEHDYKQVYLEALSRLPQEFRQQGIRMLEFGCGGGMNLLHLVSVLSKEGVHIQKAIGTDFSPVLIEAARRDAKNYLGGDEQQKLEFHVVNNEHMLADLSISAGVGQDELKNSFHFALGVNTIRYCHAARRELECARDIFDLLEPGGMCVVIDMNSKFPCFRSDLKSKWSRQEEEECYVPTLEEYTAPFVTAGFEVLRSTHFCWVPHSSGRLMCRFFSLISPVLDVVAPSRAMRSLVVSRKPR
jgi:SAM-dependent methyltransferase